MMERRTRDTGIFKDELVTFSLDDLAAMDHSEAEMLVSARDLDGVLWFQLSLAAAVLAEAGCLDPRVALACRDQGPPLLRAAFKVAACSLPADLDDATAAKLQDARIVADLIANLTDQVDRSGSHPRGLVILGLQLGKVWQRLWVRVGGSEGLARLGRAMEAGRRASKTNPFTLWLDSVLEANPSATLSEIVTLAQGEAFAGTGCIVEVDPECEQLTYRARNGREIDLSFESLRRKIRQRKLGDKRGQGSKKAAKT